MKTTDLDLNNFFNSQGSPRLILQKLRPVYQNILGDEKT